MATILPDTATDAENERQYRVVDQAISAHSMMRDRYSLRACALTLAGLVSAVCLNAFVFAGDEVFQTLGISPELARVGLGICSVVVLIVALFELRVDWAAKADQHQRASDRLSRLKMMYRTEYAAKGSEKWPEARDRLTQEYERVMDAVPKVPEAMFTRAKSAHAMKRALSKEIDKNPTAPHFVLWILVRCRGIAAALHRSANSG